MPCAEGRAFDPYVRGDKSGSQGKAPALRTPPATAAEPDLRGRVAGSDPGAARECGDCRRPEVVGGSAPEAPGSPRAARHGGGGEAHRGPAARSPLSPGTAGCPQRRREAGGGAAPRPEAGGGRRWGGRGAPRPGRPSPAALGGGRRWACEAEADGEASPVPPNPCRTRLTRVGLAHRPPGCQPRSARSSRR